MNENTIVSQPRIFVVPRRRIITPDEFFQLRPQRQVRRPTVQDVYHAAWEGAAVMAFDQSFLPTWREWQHKFCDRIHTVEDAVKYANEMLATLDDPYTRLLSPEQTSKQHDEREGTLTGIGVVFERQDSDGLPVIARVLENGPADKGGMKMGDVLVSVNGTPLAKLERNAVVDLIKGEAGTPVTIVVNRGGEKITLNLVRGIVDIPAFRIRWIEGTKIAYGQLAGFIQEDQVDEVREGLEEFSDAEGYIFGVRYNPGGQVQNCINTISLFTDEGEIVTIEQRVPMRGIQKTVYELTPDKLLTKIVDPEGRSYVQEGAREPNLTGDKPVVVLTDQYSASASEMFSGALKDLGRATIVGKTTHGKGIGQSVVPLLANTTLIVTSLRYYTPSGHWVGDGHNERYGVTPHFEVELPDGVMAGSPEDAQLNFAVEHIEKQLGS